MTFLNFIFIFNLIMILSLSPGIFFTHLKTEKKVIKWENEVTQRFLASRLSDRQHFCGLGFSSGFSVPDSALEDARIEAAGKLSETIKTWEKAVTQSSQICIRNAGEKEVVEEMSRRVTLSFSQTYLKNIDYPTLDSLFLHQKYYYAVVATASIEDYVKNAMNQVGIPENHIIGQMIKMADSIYFNLITHETP